MFNFFVKIMIFGTLLGSLSALANACKVYGISDSPQSLSCHFRTGELKLSCVNGQYVLGGLNVTQAFHMEVERGSSPLVFQAPDLKLTATKMNRFFQAELEDRSGISHGTCR